MNCRYCGAEYQTRDVYCPNCGRPTSPGAKQNQPKKPFYKKWWFWAIIIFLAIGAIGNSGESDEPTEDDISVMATETTSEVTEESTEETAGEPFEEPSECTEETTATVSDETVLFMIKYAVSSAYENYTVTLEDGILTINVWTDGIAYGAALAMAGDQNMIAEWDSMVENMKVLCNTTTDTIRGMGRYDIVVVYNVLNDLDTKNVLLSILAGEVFYDAVHE